MENLDVHKGLFNAIGRWRDLRDAQTSLTKLSKRTKGGDPSLIFPHMGELDRITSLYDKHGVSHPPKLSALNRNYPRTSEGRRVITPGFLAAQAEERKRSPYVVRERAPTESEDTRSVAAGSEYKVRPPRDESELEEDDNVVGLDETATKSVPEVKKSVHVNFNPVKKRLLKSLLDR